VLRAAIAGLTGTEPGPDTPERESLIGLHVCLLQLDHRACSITAEQLSAAVARAGEGRSPAELDLLGFAAYAAPAVGATSSEVVALAHRALRAADLSTVDGFWLIHCPVWALEFADRLDEADRWLLRILDTAQRRTGPVSSCSPPAPGLRSPAAVARLRTPSRTRGLSWNSPKRMAATTAFPSRPPPW
jgi:hypothetical protein